jgi:hypothetical protein
MMRSMITQAVEQQHLLFRYVLADSRFSSSNNMLFIHRFGKYFLMDMKSGYKEFVLIVFNVPVIRTLVYKDKWDKIKIK